MKSPARATSDTTDRKAWVAFRVFCVAMLILIAAGCVTEVTSPEPLAKTTLIVTRSMGAATLSWASERGFVYTVLFADNGESRAKWMPLPGCERIVGTGNTIQFVDDAVTGPGRRYLIKTEVASPRGR
ncbi:MAG: hypothetical protein KJ626_16340 [Verrucomicrobia bacterium]|nr:hypothetical protein [Verrucomicrobiota bacterium]